MVVVNGVNGKRSRRVMQAQEAVEVEQSPLGAVRCASSSTERNGVVMEG